MKVIRTILLALLFSLLLGFLIGTWIRVQLEKPVHYIGRNDSVERPSSSGVAVRLVRAHYPRCLVADPHERSAAC